MSFDILQVKGNVRVNGEVIHPDFRELYNQLAKAGSREVILKSKKRENLNDTLVPVLAKVLSRDKSGEPKATKEGVYFYNLFITSTPGNIDLSAIYGQGSVNKGVSLPETKIIISVGSGLDIPRYFKETRLVIKDLKLTESIIGSGKLNTSTVIKELLGVANLKLPDDIQQIIENIEKLPKK